MEANVAPARRTTLTGINRRGRQDASVGVISWPRTGAAASAACFWAARPPACSPIFEDPSPGVPIGEPMHYHYVTLEQRQALEGRIRESLAGRAEMDSALQRLRSPVFG